MAAVAAPHDQQDTGRSSIAGHHRWVWQAFTGVEACAAEDTPSAAVRAPVGGGGSSLSRMPCRVRTRGESG